MKDTEITIVPFQDEINIYLIIIQIKDAHYPSDVDPFRILS